MIDFKVNQVFGHSSSHHAALFKSACNNQIFVCQIGAAKHSFCDNTTQINGDITY